jgi:cell division protein FtsB
MSLSSLEIEVATLEYNQESTFQTVTQLALKLKEVVNQMNALTFEVAALAIEVDKLSSTDRPQ